VLALNEKSHNAILSKAYDTFGNAEEESKTMLKDLKELP